jgi:citrate/tricarballylate utilization protein
MHGTRTLDEADRLMTVCNSCRYCEGLCAVFPAMEMRRAFSDGDLNYLANLCHSCGACYVDCQFSPPHEFNVNVPKTLAVARAESYAAYAWPQALSGAFARNGLIISIVAALSMAAFIVGFAALNDRGVLLGVHTGSGAFYKLMPHNAMAALFSAAFLFAILALVMSVRAFWRDIGTPIGGRADGGSIFQAIRDAGELRYLHGGGVGCYNEDEKPTQAFPSLDVLRLPAVLCRDFDRYAVPLSPRPRGAVSVVGSAGRARHARRHRPRCRPHRAVRRQIAPGARAARR